MEKSPERRPASAFDVESALIPFCRPGTVPAQPMPHVMPMAAHGADVPVAEAVPEAPFAEEESNGWGVDSTPFAMSQSNGVPTAPRRTSSDRTRTRLLLVLGGLLHLTGVGLIIAWALGAFKTLPAENPTTPTQKQDEPDKLPKKVRQLPAG